MLIINWDAPILLLLKVKIGKDNYEIVIHRRESEFRSNIL